MKECAEAKVYRKQLIIFAGMVLVVLVMIAAIVYLVDPFYHYHKPYFGMKPVLFDRDYQVIGTVKNMDYDSVLMGSSVTENCNTKMMEGVLQSRMIKVVRASGSTADLMTLLEYAEEKQELRYVFYGLDITALLADLEPTFEQSGAPMYLYDDNPWNDYYYLWNRQVLFEKIPYVMAYSYFREYEEGMDYAWAKYKTFSAEGAMRDYDKTGAYLPQEEWEGYREIVEANVSMLREQAVGSPETEFCFFMVPYSLLWWDYAAENGMMEVYIQTIALAMKELVGLPNVTFYFFMSENEVVLNLDYYMDKIHYSASINDWMCEEMMRGKEARGESIYLVEPGEEEAFVASIRLLADRICKEEIFRYYELVIEE